MDLFLSELGILPFLSFQSSSDLSIVRKPQSKDILYLQSQNGNVYRSTGPGSPELAAFQDHFERDIPWMQEATGEGGTNHCLLTR